MLSNRQPLRTREISDNEFQKVKWKNNKISMDYIVHDFDYVVEWIIENTEGKWHCKESHVSITPGQPISTNPYIYHFKTIFWFELESDASLFKLYWI